MSVRLRILLPLFLSIALPFPALAQLTSELADEGQQAFTFAEHKDWHSALNQAQQSGSLILLKLMTWQYLLDQDSGATFDDIARFIKDNPDWPEQKKLRLRAEMALKTGGVLETDLLAWFGNDTPISGVGKIALAEALAHMKLGPEEKITKLVKDAWKDGDFDESQEKEILDKFGDKLSRTDHIGRIDRLLWEEKITPAKRILKQVDAAHQKLYDARIKLIEDKKNAGSAVNQVPAALKNDPGLMFDRMRYRARRNDDAGVRQILLATPKTVPYPEKWWKQRELQIRKSIDEGHIKTAEALLSNHAQISGTEMADAEWLKGWLQCEFLKRPRNAYDIFYQMYNQVKYPVSKARAGYWAGRAAEKSGDKQAASGWYNTASAYPTTFYGQLASIKRNGPVPLRIPAPPEIPSSEREQFDRSELVQAVKICVQLGKRDLASKLIGYLVEGTDSDSQVALAAELGDRVGEVYLSVRGAKKALQQNIVLIDAGYPTPKTPDSLIIERALALAITRQESEFDPRAKSPSGAIGMMQLMSATARDIAHKNGMGFANEKLYDPEYNIEVGSLYLARLLNHYDGSYIMAIAAYNAGPGNVHGWSNQFGRPPSDLDQAINWIEKIPFSETRNYVQRVLENIQVYRHIEADGGSASLDLAHDLTR